MIRSKIMIFLAGSTSDASASEARFSREQVAAAALMVECAQADSEFDAAEREAILRIVNERFELDSETSEELLAVAERRTHEVWHNFAFLDAIKRGFDGAQRREIIATLWDVAYIDGEVHPVEEHLIGYIAAELEVARSAVGEAREAARQRALGDDRQGGEPT